MKIISVTSGKGGVGKSNLSLNLAISLSKLGLRTIVFDADFALANIDLMIRETGEFNLKHVVAGQKTIKEVVYPGPGGIGIISGGSAIGALTHAGPKRLALFLEQMKELESECDFLIFDTAAGLDRKMITLLVASDDILLIATPDPASVTDAYAVAKTLFRKKPDARISVISNQVSGGPEGQVLYNTLNSISIRFLKSSLSYLGFVRREPNISKFLRQRNQFVLAAPELGASLDVMEIASQILTWSSSKTSFFENFQADDDLPIETAA